MCTGWPTTAMPKPSCLSERAFSRSMVVMWWPVLMWLVAGSDEVDVRWGNVVSCEMSCHVMWCNLMCLHFMWCDFLCCVMSRNALRCHVMSSHVMSCHLLWSDAVQWDEILWVCDALWLVAMSRCVLRNGCVGWIGRWSGDPNYTDLLRTTQYYKVLLRYYSVRHSTTPVLLCTTKYYSSTNFVLQSTTPVLLRTTKYYSSTTLYYKVLLQCYSVLQSTTPVLLCTTKYYSSTTVLQRTTPVLVCTARYYSSTTLYYKVLLQYYSVLQKYYSSNSLYYKVLLQYYSVLHRTTPVLLCTTKYYSSTTLYYTDLHQYNNSVLQSTTPVLLCTTKYYSLYYKVRICKARSTNVTKCCACHAKWLSWLICVTYETSFTMRRATGITLQPHQILRLPRKMTLMIDLRHIWNVISNARSNKHHSPTSPNTAPATQNCIPKSKRNCPKTVEVSIPTRGRFEHDPNMIRTRSEHELVISHPPVRWGYFSRFGDAFCIENYNISRSGYLPRFHRILRLPQKVTLQDHQILRLPRKMTLMIDVRHTWHVIYNARSNRSHPPTSPNAAPATQNDSHHLSSWHMKRYLQCAEQQASPSKFTKRCACHVKWLSWLMSATYETSFPMRGATGITLQPHQILRLPRKIAVQNLRKTLWKQLKCQFQCGDDSTMIRPWSEHELVISHPPVRGGSFSHFGDTFCIENYNISRSRYLPRFHRILRLPQKVTLQERQLLRLPQKVTLQEHQILRLPQKVTLQDHQILRLPQKVTLQEHQILRLPQKVTLQEHQILRLPQQVTLQDHQILRLPQKVNCYWAVTQLSCYWTVTQVSCYWTVTQLSWTCYSSELLLNCYSSELLLNCYSTELLLNCYSTELNLLLKWAVTELLLKWAVTELLLNWAVTELLLNWAEPVTQLSCYWTVTQVSCYWTVTQLSCYWTVTQVSCYWTELLLHF